MSFTDEDQATMRRVIAQYGSFDVAYDIDAPDESRWLVDLYDDRQQGKLVGEGRTFTTAVFDAEKGR